MNRIENTVKEKDWTNKGTRKEEKVGEKEEEESEDKVWLLKEGYSRWEKG